MPIKKHGGGAKDNTSYNNDWSNVARMWDNYDKKNLYRRNWYRR